MACDWYVAVCNPLRYAVIINQGVCANGPSVLDWGHFSFYSPHILYYESAYLWLQRNPPFLLWDTSNHEDLMQRHFHLWSGGLCDGHHIYYHPLLDLLWLHTPSSSSLSCIWNPPQDRNKALVPASPNLTVVSFYLGPYVYMYVTPGSSHTPDQEQAVSVFCTVLTPMLNPLIYSLRNKDVVGAIQKVLRKHPVSKWNTYISRWKTVI